MLEALWSVEFVSSLGGFGGGVVVFETGRVFGGDGQYYYLGNYKVAGETASGEAEITHYSGQPYSVFGQRKKFRIRVSGKLQEPTMELKGYLVDDPSMEIVMRLTKRADLP